MAKKKRQSVIRKSVQVLVNTGYYENVTVGSQYEETIEWADTDERVQKEQSMMGFLLKNLQKDINAALEATGRKRDSNAERASSTPKTSSKEMGLTDLGEGEDL